MKQESGRNQPVRSEPSLPITLDQSEDRGIPRLPVLVDAETVDVNRRTSVTGRATDLGVGGCFVDTIDTFPWARRLEFVSLGKDGVSTVARWSHAWLAVGE